MYPRFSEYELSVALSVLKQGNKKVMFIGLDRNMVSGEAGLTCVPDVSIDEVDVGELDSLLLPGVDDFKHLVNHEKLAFFLRKLSTCNLIIGAISSAPYLLSMSGLLVGKKYTTGLLREQRTFLGTFEEDKFIQSPMVQDGNILTAKGSSFIEFAWKFGELLGLKFDKNWYVGGDLNES